MLYANVGPDGVIVYEPHADPALARLPVADVPNHEAEKLKKIISVNARHSKCGTFLLVPGVPEAETQEEAITALFRFRRLIEMRMNGESGWPA